MPHVELPQAEFKVVMLGDSNTGKTSLVLRFAEGYYRESARSATVGAFFITKRLQVNGITCKIQIWDTAGQEQFKPLAPMYYKNAAAAILCFDVSSPQSLRTLKYWMEELHRNVPAGRIVICMAATKIDLLPTASSPMNHSHNQNTEELYQLHAEAAQLAQEVGCLFVETSAKHNSNVTELFKVVAERVLQYQQTLKGKAALEIPVTRGILDSNDLLTSSGNNHHNNYSPHGSNGNYASESPFPASSITPTTPSRRRHSTTDTTSTVLWSANINNVSSPQYYSSNDVPVMGIQNNHNNTQSPFTTPPLSAPSSKLSSPVQSTNKHVGNGAYYDYNGAAVEQVPPPSSTEQHRHGVADDSQVIRSTANASPISPSTGVMCGDDSNPLMCGVLLPSSSSSPSTRWTDENGNEHVYPTNGSTASSSTTCTIL